MRQDGEGVNVVVSAGTSELSAIVLTVAGE